jgi:hypothetical protein
MFLLKPEPMSARRIQSPRGTRRTRPTRPTHVVVWVGEEDGPRVINVVVELLSVSVGYPTLERSGSYVAAAV